MRFLVDAQLPPSLARFLAEHGEQATACRDVGLRDAADDEIWQFASTGGWCIVTKDEDFAIRRITVTNGPRLFGFESATVRTQRCFSGSVHCGQMWSRSSVQGRGLSK